MATGATVARRRERRLFRRYLFVLVLLVSTVLLVSSGLQSYVAYQQNRNALGRIQQGQAATAAVKIEQFISDIFPPIDAANQTLRNLGNPTLEQRQDEYLHLMREVQAISDLRYLDATGHELLALHRTGLKVIDSGVGAENDQAFLQAKTGRPYFGPVSFRDGSEPNMTIATADAMARGVPAPGGSSGLGGLGGGGVTVVDVNLKFIWDVVAQIKVGKAGVVYVVDGRGKLIAHPDLSLVLQNTDVSALPQVRAARRTGDAR